MADSDKTLTVRQALTFLGVELKKRMDDFGAQCLELRKKEQSATGKPLVKALPGELAHGAISSPPPPPPPAPVAKDEMDGGDPMQMGEKKRSKKKPSLKHPEEIEGGDLVMDEDDMNKDEIDGDGPKVPKDERAPGSKLPGDGPAKTVSDPEGSEGDVKKLKMAKADPMGAPKAPGMPKASPPPIPAGAMKSPKMAGAAIPPPMPGMKPLKLPGLTLPKGPGVGAPSAAPAAPAAGGMKKSFDPKDLATVNKQSPQLRPRDAMKQAIKLPASAPVIGGAAVAGAGKPAHVQTMVERVASNMGPKGPMAGPPRIALPGGGLFAKKPAVAAPPPIPADAKPAVKKPVK